MTKEENNSTLRGCECRNTTPWVEMKFNFVSQKCDSIDILKCHVWRSNEITFWWKRISSGQSEVCKDPVSIYLQITNIFSLQKTLERLPIIKILSSRRFLDGTFCFSPFSLRLVFVLLALLLLLASLLVFLLASLLFFPSSPQHREDSKPRTYVEKSFWKM